MSYKSLLKYLWFLLTLIIFAVFITFVPIAAATSINNVLTASLPKDSHPSQAHKIKTFKSDQSKSKENVINLFDNIEESVYADLPFILPGIKVDVSLLIVLILLTCALLLLGHNNHTNDDDEDVIGETLFKIRTSLNSIHGFANVILKHNLPRNIASPTQKAFLTEIVSGSSDLEYYLNQVTRASSNFKIKKNEFMTNISFKLRTNLTGIRGFAELVRNGTVGPISANDQEYLQLIVTSTDEVLRIIG